MAGIFVLSSIANPPDLPAGTDKNLHALLYAGLSVLAVRAFAAASWSRVSWRDVLSATALCAVYGVSDELHQTLVPGRQADPLDVLADTTGAAVAAVAVRLWVVVRSRRN